MGRWLPSHATILGKSLGKQELGLAESCFHAVTQIPPEREADPKGGEKVFFTLFSLYTKSKTKTKQTTKKTTTSSIMKNTEASSPKQPVPLTQRKGLVSQKPGCPLTLY